MGKKKKSTRKKSAKADNGRIERFGSDGSEIRVVQIAVKQKTIDAVKTSNK